jgi:hypothetical protein
MDFLEKLTRILFTIVLGGLVAVAGVKIQWDKIGIETDTLCFNQYKLVSELPNQAAGIQASLVKRYAERCGVTEMVASEELNSALAAVEMASADGSGSSGTQEPQIVISMTAEDDPRIIANGFPDAPPPEPVITGAAVPAVLPAGTGNAAIGRAQTSTFAQVNFDRVDGRPATGDGSAPALGDVLRARWEVNLRANLTVTTQGGNPVLDTLAKGDCVKVLSMPENLRGQFWSLVQRTDCPA